jgi:hypothetical protein
VTLQNELEALFEAPPASAASCAGLWAAAMLDYAADVVPASTTVSTAAETLATALDAAFASPTAPADFDAAFTAFAASVGGGMAPAFAATPPALPLGIGALLVESQPTHATIDLTTATVESAVDRLAAAVESVLRAVAALIEPLLDTIAAALGALRRRLRPDLRAAHEQPQTEPYCAAFHLRPPWPREVGCRC